MKSKLSLKIMGVRGGEPSWSENKGYVSAFIDDANSPKDVITVDAFEGFGDDYKRRERCRITIARDSHPIFQGTFQELVEKLAR